MKKLTLIIILSLALLTSCGSTKEKKSFSSYSFDYFDTVTSIVGYEYSQEEFDIISNEIFEMLGEYHRLFTIYDRYENLNNLVTVNQLTNGVHEQVEVDERLMDMLVFAKDVYDLTDGSMNIAMGSVLSIWHDYRTQGIKDPANAQLPPMDKLLAASRHMNIDDLIIDETNKTVFLADPEMRLDVGAIAKGYAVEAIAMELESRGISGYCINVGGNVRTIGSKPDGSGWAVGIENPTGSEDQPYIEILELAGESLVTSGSYQRFYYVNGKSFHHIINPQTLMPAEDFLSVSVICKSSALADGLSTALFTMPLEKGMELVKSLEGVRVIWVKNNEEKVYSYRP